MLRDKNKLLLINLVKIQKLEYVIYLKYFYLNKLVNYKYHHLHFGLIIEAYRIIY